MDILYLHLFKLYTCYSLSFFYHSVRVDSAEIRYSVIDMRQYIDMFNIIYI